MGGVDLFTLSKYERLLELSRYGLNTPAYVSFMRGEFDQFREYTLGPGNEIAPDKRVSIRFYGADDILMGTQPHLPNVSWAEAKVAIHKYLQDYNIMFDPVGCNPDHTIVCGNLQLELHSIDGFGIAIFEFRFGSGTVRHVQSRPSEHLTCNLHEFPCPPELPGCARWQYLGLARAKAAALKCPYWNGGIFEWSYYPYGTGWKNQPIMFWEIRKQAYR